ncbi:MAG: hypothetical protein F6K47_18315 [Symploca sp. SIO2E6]|nr:hypothetical protein [Symploca sp. SIO2E6]
MKKIFLYPLLGTLGIVLVVAYTRTNGQTNQLFTETVPPSELLQAPKNCSTYSGQVSLLTAIADNYAKIGQKDKSLEILAQALPLVQCISDKCNQSEPLAAIAGQYALIGQEVRASEILNQAIQIAQTAQGCMSHNDLFENLYDISERYLRVSCVWSICEKWDVPENFGNPQGYRQGSFCITVIVECDKISHYPPLQIINY